MRKKYITISILVGLAILVISLQKSGSTLHKNSKEIALKEVENTNRLILRKLNNIIELNKEDDIWMLEDKMANQQQAQELLTLSTLIKAYAPVPLELEIFVDSLLENGTVISFYNNRKRLGGFSINIWDNMLYARKRKAKQAYRIEITGYPNVDLVKLALPTITNWQNNILFRYEPFQISSFTLNFPTKPEKGFRITQDEHMNLKLYTHDNIYIDTISNTETVRNYLHFFSGIKYRKASNEKSPINETNKFFVMKVESRNGESQLLTAYLKINMESDKTDPYQFYAMNEQNELILLNYTDFDPLLLPLDYFLKK